MFETKIIHNTEILKIMKTIVFFCQIIRLNSDELKKWHAFEEIKKNISFYFYHYHIIQSYTRLMPQCGLKHYRVCKKKVQIKFSEHS